MKTILKSFALFAAFAVVFSNLSGCGGGSGAADSPSGDVPSRGSHNPDGAGSKYPPLVSAIANADIELLDGTKTRISDRKGKVLLINLWATWCGPCRKEMPYLVEMQDKYRDQGFQVLGLNVGEGGRPEEIDKINNFSEMMKLNYELARIPEEVTNEFYRLTEFPAIPISLLIDSEGRLRGVFLGGGPNVIKKMTATVAKVVAGDENGDVPSEGVASSNSSRPDGGKMELKAAESE